MSRNLASDRQRAVLAAAEDLLDRARREWANGITFGRLADATGIDQAQIARDFGSKEALLEALVDHVLDPATYPGYAGHLRDWLLERPPSGTSLAAVVDQWATASDEMNVALEGLSRAEFMFFAATSEGSLERERLRSTYDDMIDGMTGVCESFVSAGLVQGAVARGDIQPEEVIVAMTAMIVGMGFLRPLMRERVPDDLTARVAKLLVAGMVGPDSRSPIADVDSVTL